MVPSLLGRQGVTLKTIMKLYKASPPPLLLPYNPDSYHAYVLVVKEFHFTKFAKVFYYEAPDLIRGGGQGQGSYIPPR